MDETGSDDGPLIQRIKQLERGLEQEIGSLRKKIAACVRENQNLQEELSEAYRIKGQLADLHGAEVSKVSMCLLFK
ncbi:hypothetical protein Taro_042554 [Colocasia esculenta]|uniref:Uncharacterized protein n=1 Tax=Colocasia esculenta TaxID=4460 RepID=A0A843WYT0_COLES|nr:hypothetical protein [Colocasia esculenta]